MSPTPARYGFVKYGGTTRYSSASVTPKGNVHMAHVAQNLDGLSVADLIPKGHTALNAAGSADGILVLGTPTPGEVAALQVATDKLELAHDEKLSADNDAKTATQVQLAAIIVFKDAYGAYGRVGQTKSGGDPVKIGAIGLDVATGHSPSGGALPAPTNLTAEMGALPGQVFLACDVLTGAKLFIWQVCTDPMLEANWRQIGMDSKTKCTATGLISGTKYWFRVAALGTGTGNQSPWSDPVLKMAP